MTNATARCFTQRAPLPEPSFIQNGQWTFQAHHVGWIVASFFTIIATIVSFWLIGKHLMWYTKKRQQRFIVRLLLMVPIYSIVSLASYIFWNHAIPITLVRDSYESFVLYSFFYLLLQYLSPTVEGQKDVFRKVVLRKWMFPLGSIKYRPVDGLYFLQLMKWGLLQYCIIRPVTTLAAVILDFIGDFAGLYCADSWNPGWGHIYITIIVSVSVSIAMFCLLQFYVAVSEPLAPYKPLLKLFAVKAVVFLTFWQATGLSVLTMAGVVKDTKYMTADDINTGIAALLETFEMMCFAILHVRAFSYLPYRPDGYEASDHTPRFHSLMHALDIRDMWREIRDGSVYMGKTIRGVEAEEEIRRRIHFAMVTGRERELSQTGKGKEGWPIKDSFYDDDQLLNSQNRRGGHARRGAWLSELGDRFGGDFEDEVEEALRKREWDHQKSPDTDLDYSPPGHSHGKSTWWRGIYDRLSQSGPDRDREGRLSPIPERPSRGRNRRNRSSDMPSLDSPPPSPSVTFEYSGKADGYPTVRLLSTHRKEPSAGMLDRLTKSGGGPSRPFAKLSVSERFPAKRDSGHAAYDGNFLAPRPMPVPGSRDIELLVSSHEKQLPPTPLHDGDGDDLVAASSVARSDSLLARVFADPSSPSYDGHSSSGRTEPASSSHTHSTQLIYPMSLTRPSLDFLRSSGNGKMLSSPKSSPLSPVDLTSYPRLSSPRSSPSRDPQTSNLGQRSRPRPHVVLPAPLSPARYPTEVLHRGLGNTSSQIVEGSSPVRDQQTTEHPALSWSFPRSATAPQNRGILDKRESRLRHSSQKEVSGGKGWETKGMADRVMEFTHPHSTAAHTVYTQSNASPPLQAGEVADGVPPSPLSKDVRTEIPQSPTIPVGTVGSPLLMTSPSSPSPSHHLRHTRGDVGTTKRPWS